MTRRNVQIRHTFNKFSRANASGGFESVLSLGPGRSFRIENIIPVIYKGSTRGRNIKWKGQIGSPVCEASMSSNF